jgi:preprotein translocase subunit SecD
MKPMWRRVLGLVALMATTVLLAGGSSAGAAAGIHRATYAPIGSATSAQLKTVARIFINRLASLGDSFVHVAVHYNDIILSSTGRAIPVSLLDEVGQTAQLYFRPVLCFAPPLVNLTSKSKNSNVSVSGTSSANSLASCGTAYQTTRSNVGISPNNSVQGYTINPNLQADPQYSIVEDTPTTAANYQNRDVLLPGIGANGKASDAIGRYVLGPEQMTGHAIGSARAELDQAGNWVVNYSMAGRAGAALWDRVAASDFHQYVGIELDGVVYSAPIIQPQQSSYTSFNGNGQISGGNLTRADAERLAQAMKIGSLPVRMELLTTRS